MVSYHLNNEWEYFLTLASFSSLVHHDHPLLQVSPCFPCTKLPFLASLQAHHYHPLFLPVLTPSVERRRRNKEEKEEEEKKKKDTKLSFSLSLP